MTRKLRELNDRKSGLSFQYRNYSLRSLFVLTAVVAVGVLIVQEIHFRFGPSAAAVIILAVLSIFAHVAGAALGGRLRASQDVGNSDTEDDGEDPEGSVGKLTQPMEARKSDFAPTTQLSKQKPLQRQPIYYGVGIGAAFCSIVASAVLTWFMWNDLAIVNVLFGAVSAAVIGGLFGFLATSLYQVVREALDEAQKDATR
jgi:predicted lysophospholipase L1 biosynthesis ABC-type transport system permease subunit